MLLLGAALYLPHADALDFPERESRVWQVEEWEIGDVEWSGNPFDVPAEVRFVHVETEEQIESHLFYAGENQWKFRFTATRPGNWRFTTHSDHPALDGHSGSIVVGPRAGDDVKGFLTGVGNKYAIMEENADDLSGFVFQAYMNQQDFEQQYRHDSRILGAPDRAHLIEPYWEDTRENGFNMYFFAVFYSWFRMGALSIEDFDGPQDPALETPDLALFEVLETAILHAHAQGGHTHIWAWGDNGRRQTPNNLEGGFQGEQHRRLMRYIAARLGPLPGWSMNLGFDTDEMPDAEGSSIWWAQTMRDLMGWPHILTSRGWHDASFGARSFAGFGGTTYDLRSTYCGPVSYAEVVEHLHADPHSPAVYEERHTYNRWECWPHEVPDKQRLNTDGSRRLIWWQAMAGGMGGFWGHFSERFNDYGPFDPDGPCGYHPEALKTAFRTFREFWKDGRLKLSMQPDNQRVLGESAGYCLSTADNAQMIFFFEGVEEATVDLAEMPGEQPVVAINAKAPYKEIPLGDYSAGTQHFSFDEASDWVLAVGAF